MDQIANARQVIGVCDRTKLQSLLDRLGYPRQTITPELIQRVAKEEGDRFKIPFLSLALEGYKRSQNLSRATGDQPTDTTTTKPKSSFDVNNFLSGLFNLGVAGFGASTQWGIDLNGTTANNRDTAYYNSQAAQAQADAVKASNPWPWLIGGIVVIGIIVAIVMTSRK